MGEAPINTLSSDSIPQDGAIALAIFDEVNREVQTQGWYFNTDLNVELALNSDNYIPIPASALRLDIPKNETGYEDVVQRGGFLYNTSSTANSDRFIFSGSLKAAIIYYLEFTDIPQPAREYVVAKAARLLQERLIGSADLSKVLIVREQDARTTLMAHEIRSSQLTYIDDPDSQNSLNRYI